MKILNNLKEFKMTRKYLMVGSSWAWSSFDREDPDPKTKPTFNYSDVWGFDYENLSRRGASNQDCFDIIKNYNKEKLPVIWFWCAPFNYIDEVDHETQLNLISKDWETYYNTLNSNLQKKINSLDHKILIIGCHSDPPKTGWDDHITILDNSIQDFISQRCGTKKTMNFPVEVFSQLIFKKWRKKPDRSLIKEVYLGYKRWSVWEQQEYFFWTHPTKRAVEEFAEFSREKVRLWLSS